MGLIEFALIDPSTPHPPEATVSEAGVLYFNAASERVLDLKEGLTFAPGAYVNADDPPPLLLLIDPAICGIRPIPPVELEKREEGFCIDLANVFRQLGIDFTSQRLILSAWIVKWQKHYAIAFPISPQALSSP